MNGVIENKKTFCFGVVPYRNQTFQYASARFRFVHCLVKVLNLHKYCFWKGGCKPEAGRVGGDKIIRAAGAEGD